MSLTCGSVGDILAVAGLVKELVVALSDSRGASADYQQVTSTLQNLLSLLLALDELSKLSEQRGNSIAESFTARFQAQQCHQYIAEFFEKIQKYDQALRKGGSRNIGKDAYWKLHYRVTLKECVDQFRQEIQLQIGLINALICTEAYRSQLLRDDRIQEQIQATNMRIDQSVIANSAMFARLYERVVRPEKSIAWDQLFSLAAKLPPGFNLARGRDLIWRTSLETFGIFIGLMNQAPQSLNPWNEPPAELDDALCRQIRIPLETIRSWKDFEMILSSRFANDEGLNRIMRRQYTLQDPRTKEAYQMTRPFTDCFRPRRRIVMSALFSETNFEYRSCPGCKTVCNRDWSLGDEEVLCYCGIRWGRINSDLKEAARIGHAVEMSQDSPLGFKRIKIISKTRLGRCGCCGGDDEQPSDFIFHSCMCGHIFTDDQFWKVTNE